MRLGLSLYSLLLILVLAGCGVETDSNAIPLVNSGSLISGEVNTSASSSVDTNQSAGVDTNVTNNEINGTINDSNETVDGNVSSVVSDDKPDNVIGSDAGFEMNDAELDENACIINSAYSAISDTSLDPISTTDSKNSLEISSKYPYNTDVDLTKVALFFPELTVPVSATSVIVYEDKFRFGFDRAWVDNVNKNIYIRTPKVNGRFFKCYRYSLDSILSENIKAVKVYR